MIKKGFVIFDQRYRNDLFDFKQHDKLRDEIITTILLNPYTMVLVKPHPRQNVELLKEKLVKYNSERVMIVEEPSMFLADTCIPVILGESSICFDCLAMDSPAIEYSRNAGSIYKGLYRKGGFVYPANNPGELIEGVKKIYGVVLDIGKHQ